MIFLRLTRGQAIAYPLALLVLALDQLSKIWVLEELRHAQGGVIEVLPIFHLRLVMNPGVSFGLFRADSGLGKWLIVAFAAAVVILLAWWTRKVAHRLTAAGLGLIMGGAVGNNFIDRVRFGAVVDFFDFSPIFPWVFNVADSAITVGVALLLIDSFRPRKDEEGVTAAS